MPKEVMKEIREWDKEEFEAYKKECHREQREKAEELRRRNNPRRLDELLDEYQEQQQEMYAELKAKVIEAFAEVHKAGVEEGRAEKIVELRG